MFKQNLCQIHAGIYSLTWVIQVFLKKLKEIAAKDMEKWVKFTRQIK